MICGRFFTPLYEKCLTGSCEACGEENGARTRDLNLGKVALYQLSYFKERSISTISLGVTTKGFFGKCLVFPVTR